jgi:hypothetical protein
LLLTGVTKLWPLADSDVSFMYWSRMSTALRISCCAHFRISASPSFAVFAFLLHKIFSDFTWASTCLFIHKRYGQDMDMN